MNKRWEKIMTGATAAYLYAGGIACLAFAALLNSGLSGSLIVVGIGLTLGAVAWAAANL